MRHLEGMMVVFLGFTFAALGSAQNPIFGARERDPFLPSAPSGRVLPIDADGDGAVDLIVDEGELVFYRNEGPGKFVRQATSPGFLSADAVVGDIDGDGDLDFVVRSTVFRSIGGGHFVQAALPQLSFWLLDLPMLLDADGDGDLDIALRANTLRLLQNNGAGVFSDVTPASLPGGIVPQSVAMLDADQDGDMDLVVGEGNFSLLSASLLRNNGQGVFTEEPLVIPFSFGLSITVQAADLDGDSDVDVSVGAWGTPLVPMLNDGAGTFIAVPSSGLPLLAALPQFSAWVDWDLDGRAEMVNAEGLWSHSGNYQFHVTRWPLRRPGVTVRLADLDGDLDLDLLAEGDPIVVTMNTSGGPMQAATTAATTATLGMQRFFGDNLRPAGGLVVQGTHLASYQIVQGGWQRNRVLSPWLPVPTLPFTSAAPVSPWRGVATCDTGGRALFHRNDFAAPYSFVLPVSPTVTNVAAGALYSNEDDIVFGDPTIDGPQILVGDPFSGYVLEPRLNLSPAASSSAPVAETVVIADMDGDGRNDIVHELRVLHNDGGGAWSQVADFALQVGPTSTDLTAIDFDRDGDSDLVAWGGTSPTLLLRNDGSHFVDVTFGHIPPPEIAPAQLISKGDIDGDGDDDLLVARGTQCNLLRNDGGVFTRIVNVAPRGVLVDINDDGRADVFTGDNVLYNLFANLHAPRLALPGTEWLLQVSTWRQGALPYLGLIAVGSHVVPVPATVPGLGKLFVDPASAVVLPVTLTSGRGERVLQIPNTPLALGINLVAQAVVLDQNGIALTGPVFDAVR